MRLGKGSVGVRAGGKEGCASRAFGLAFGLIFLAFGVGFTFLLAREVWQQAQTRRWMATPCQVLDASVRQDQQASSKQKPYRVALRYRYFAGGEEQVGTALKLKDNGFEHYTDAQATANRYPVGGSTTCYVDRADPKRAVLEHGPLWIGFFVVLPLIFVLIGGGVAWISIRGTPTATTAASNANRALSERAINPAAGRRYVVAFFALFLLVGLGASIPLLILPVLRIVRSASWPQVSCTIVSSRVAQSSSDDGPTYRPDILFAYTYNGQTYRSDRYSADSYIYSSGRKRSADVVAGYRPGTQATCYVDPSEPSMAMLSRDWSWAMVAMGAIPTVFTLIGGGGVYFTLRRRPATAAGSFGGKTPSTEKWSSPPRPIHSYASDAAGAGGTVTLRPKHGPVAKLIGAVAVTLFWNGIVSIFVYHIASDWSRGRGDMCGTAFMTPFVLIGLFLVGVTIHSSLALFNPRPELTLERSMLALGDSCEVKWRFDGRYDRIGRLRLTLEGREEATYRRGTDSRTDKHVFFKSDMLDTTRRTEFASGKCRLTIPADLMHSFEAPNNKIVWELTLHGEIAGWPDVKEQFPLQVRPLPPTRGGGVAAAGGEPA